MKLKWVMKYTIINLLKNSFSVIIALLVISGCRKDTLNNPLNSFKFVNENCFCEIDCNEFPETSSELGYITTYSGNQFTKPIFNPTNANEFVYIRKSENWFSSELVKINLEEMSETILDNSINIVGSLDWNETGWIVFTSDTWQIWKIREDGSDLTQLTFGVWDTNPHFSFDGSVVYYYRGKAYSIAEKLENPELSKEIKIIGIDINGNDVDSIMAPSVQNKISEIFSYQIWETAFFSESEIYFIDGPSPIYGLYSLNPNSNEIRAIKRWKIDGNNYELIEDIQYSNGYLYTTKFRNHFIRVNIFTGDVEYLKCGCDQNFYSEISISPNRDRILYEKIRSNVLSYEEIDKQHEIWIMDMDGCNAQKLLGD